MKLLLAGDLHIGRASTQAPETVPRATLRAAEAWQRLVDLAIAERVSAVCLSGDVADAANRFWEAVGPLERGVTRLGEAGIDVLAVAGNHDHDVLGGLASSLQGGRFHLLGQGGTWERTTLHDAHGPAVHIDGWSFPEAAVQQSPLDEYDLPPASDAPILGLIHGELDTPASRYAPLASSRLSSLPPHAWLLGHWHAPSLTASQAGWVLYPGSPQALDPGEPGAHGVWLVEAGAGGLGEPAFRPLSTVRYESLNVELDERVQTAEQFHAHLFSQVRALADAAAEEGGQALQGLSLRVELGGRSPLAGEASALLQQVAEASEAYRAGQMTVAVQRAESRVEPALDWSALAEDRSALGAAARVVLELEKQEPAEDVRALVQAARQRIRQIRDVPHYADLPDEPAVDEALARDYLRRQARALAGELHSQINS